jgi:hypothetical protein
MRTQTAWLLEGDVAIQYLTQRDLLHAPPEQLRALQTRLPEVGICARLLTCQHADGHWGQHYYQPKWTSTHYTLLELKNIGTPPALPACRGIVQRMFDECRLANGGLNLAKHPHAGDTCVDGMALTYAAYFCPEEPRLDALAAHLLAEQRPDGSFTWDANSGSGDPHTTICVLEGLAQYAASRSRASITIKDAIRRGVTFLLENNLFFEGADKRFTKLTYPHRYRYDCLRALAFFARYGVAFDARMLPALCWLAGKQMENGLWNLEYVHPGSVHFELEPVGQPSRFVTLNALIVLAAYQSALADCAAL